MTVNEAVKLIEDTMQVSFDTLTKTEQLTVVRRLIPKLTNLEETLLEEVDPE